MTIEDYLQSAVSRMEAGSVSSEFGSHVAGIVGRAAQQYEEHWRRCLESCLREAGVTYQGHIQAQVQGPADLKMLTLGKIIQAIEILHQSHPSVLHARLAGASMPDLCRSMKRVNKIWRHVKHGRGVQFPQALQACRDMLASLPHGGAQ